MHYHIRWSDSKLDWKPFRTREEAEQAARRLARRGETFTVEHADGKTCTALCKAVDDLLQAPAPPDTRAS